MIGGPSRQLRASSLIIKAGVGYEFLSQEYFLDTTRSDVDSTLANWELTTTYLDDLKGQLTLFYVPDRGRQWELSTHYEQTAEFIRSRSATRWHLRPGNARLDLSAEFNTKHRYRGQAEFGDSYVQGYLRGKLRKPLSKSLSIVFQLRSDGVKFRDLAEHNYNYFRAGGKIGVEKIFQNYSMADCLLLLTRRFVPDSSELSYLAYGFEGSLLAFHSAGELDILARWEGKDYQYEDDLNDLGQWQVDARHKLRFGPSWFSRQELAFEATRYEDNSAARVNYSRLELAVLMGYNAGSASIALGPHLDHLQEREEVDVDRGNYNELGLRVDLDYLSPGAIFCSIESVTGARSLDLESDIRSDFVFERVMLIGDFDLTGGLGLSLLFSGEWEWHDRPEDNSRLFLLSSNLMYTF